MFYSIGIPLTVLFFIGLLQQRFFVHKWMIATLLILSLLSEGIIYCPFLLAIFFSGLKNAKPHRNLASSPSGAEL